MDFNRRGRKQQFTDGRVKQLPRKSVTKKNMKKTNLDVKKHLRFVQDKPYSEKRILHV